MKNLIILLTIFFLSCSSDNSEEQTNDLTNKSIVCISGNLDENKIFKEYLGTHYYHEFKCDIVFFDGSSKTITIRNNKNCPSATGNFEEIYNQKIKFIDLYVRITDSYENVRFSEKKRVNFPDFNFGKRMNFNVKNGILTLICEN